MTATERMATQVRDDARLGEQRSFVYRLESILIEHARAYPTVPGDLPDHDITFNAELGEALLAMFKREPDILATFLPEHYVAVDRRHLERIMDTLANAVPITPGSLGPVDGKMLAENVIRQSAHWLCGASEMARRQHEEQEDAAMEKKLREVFSEPNPNPDA